MPDLILGVDGGSSKTHFALADEHGRLRGFTRGPGTNHEGIGFEPIRRIFAGMLAGACRQARARPKNIKAACFGLCGADLSRDFAKFESGSIAPLGMGGPVKVHNDAFIALFNDQLRRRGVAITSGSWHKWLAMNGRRTFMIDGWGTRGLRELALLAPSQAVEGYRPHTAFISRLVRYLGFSSPRDFAERMYYGQGRRSYVRPMPRNYGRRYSRIPEWLARETGRGSAGACEVIDAYAAELSDGARAVIGATGLSREKFDIVLSGSVLAGMPALRLAFGRRARRFAPRARVLVARFRPVRGALNYAAHLAGWKLPAGALRAAALTYGQA